jgi:hypothetical protein
MANANGKENSQQEASEDDEEGEFLRLIDVSSINVKSISFYDR